MFNNNNNNYYYNNYNNYNSNNSNNYNSNNYNNINQLIQKLLDDLAKTLSDKMFIDLQIEVGEKPNSKTFQAHSVIFYYRSSYFRKILSSSNDNNNDDNDNNDNDNNMKEMNKNMKEEANKGKNVIEVVNENENKKKIVKIIKIPNISIEVFEVMFNYVYSGMINLEEKSSPEFFLDILIAANQLEFIELVNYIQNYMIERHDKWLIENFILIHRISFQYELFNCFQKYCVNAMAENPEITKILDFKLISPQALEMLIRRDDLKLEEIDVWKFLINWGITQISNPNHLKSIEDYKDWSLEDFKSMKEILDPLLPFVRFREITSKQFFEHVRPYNKLFHIEMYEDLIRYFMIPGSDPLSIMIWPPRRGMMDSFIITSKHSALISSWIDQRSRSFSPLGFNHYNIENNPYEFKLILRGSRDGFSSADFHRLADGKSCTITILKVHETGEILGGYNPLKWESRNCRLKTEESFLFSFNDRITILSRIKSREIALKFDSTYGPTFGICDLVMWGKNFSGGSKHQIACTSVCASYEREISSIKHFSVDEYEIFQIVEKNKSSSLSGNVK
ncbi:hypothetical protein Glove_209g53 [Diversispora epigaea]|uniref:BTB domain-containing protein n=1 Tax=Diversispora epigaea TaxID=1348612 RepID=A0A397IIG6_9GLOM|nr:hypothetical protein Glove_209g53 [Diversispora epigaea]